MMKTRRNNDHPKSSMYVFTVPYGSSNRAHNIALARVCRSTHTHTHTIGFGVSDRRIAMKSITNCQTNIIIVRSFRSVRWLGLANY